MPPKKQPLGSSFEDDRYVEQMLKDKAKHDSDFVKRMHEKIKYGDDLQLKIAEKKRIIAELKANKANESTPKKDIEKMLSEAKKMKNVKYHNTPDDIIKTIFNVIEHKLQKKVKAYNTSDDVLKTIFNVIEKDLPKSRKVNKKEISELIGKVEEKLKTKKPEKRLLLDAYEYRGNKSLIEQLADSIKSYPEFDTINKGKIKKYSFDVVDKFNKKYPELMLRLFKDQKSIDKLLTKKSDNVQKRALSEEKEKARKQKYSEKAKEERKEKKKEKVKHLDDLTPEEFLKFQQARNYYMRKSKTSTILPKNLNKEDPEALNMVCKELAEKGFETMSEQLFMQIYEG